jgi:ABC-type transport system involved in multi-copper enzyme maturation permease subunit
MSTVMITHANRVRPTHQPGFTDLLRSEWTKFKTLRSTWWSLGIMIAVSLGVSIAATSAFTATYDNLGAADKTRFQNDTIGLLLQPGSQFGQLAIAVLGVLLIASEFSTGMIRSTVLAAPRRTPVLAAKAVVLGAVVFVLAEAIAWANFFIGSAIVRKHATVTLSTPGTLRAILGFGLVMSLTAIIALAIGALMRHTAGAISVALGTSLVVPGLLGLIPGSLGQHLSQAMPESAGQLIMDRTLDPGTPYGQWGGLAIIVAWTVGLMALAFISIKRRDV